MFCIGVLALLLPFVSVAAPVRLILDTDIGNDIDDALALATIHALQNRGEVELLAVTISKDNRFAAPYVNLVNTSIKSKCRCSLLIYGYGRSFGTVAVG